MAGERPTVRLIREGFPQRPAFGTAVSEAILLRVAGGGLPPTLRLHRPGAELAFSKQDSLARGFERAARAARAEGFEPVIRLAGGRAAAFYEGTLAIALATPDSDPRRSTVERFELVSNVVAGAMRDLGIDARVGEIPGEYCPGEWSVNAGGRVKLAGIGQRLVARAAHVGAVVVVDEPERLRRVLEPVYRALALSWDPATVGAVATEAPGAGLDEVEAAILARFAEHHALEPARLDSKTLGLAERLERGRRGPPSGVGSRTP